MAKGKIFRVKRKRRFYFLYLPLILVITAGIVLCLIIVNPGYEKKVGGFRDFRAEGLSLYEAAPSSIKYIRKYLHKSSKASDSVVAHFREQSRLIEKRREWEREQYGGKIPAESLLRISFVGDIMWIRNGWNTFLDSKVRDYLSESDLVFGNLETPIDTLTKVPWILPDYAKYNANPKLLTSFRRDNGNPIFTALSVANNHTLDGGIEGLRRTLEFLDKEGVKYSGAGVKYTDDKLKSLSGAKSTRSKRYLIIEKNGIKIGFYAAAWGLNNPSLLRSGNIEFNTIDGIAPLRSELINIAPINEVIKEMKEDDIDLIILYLHWGYEYELYPDFEIMKIGRELARAGADFIIGTHPHVIQPSEICLANGYTLIESSDSLANTHPQIFYTFEDEEQIPRKSLIEYSLGNFTTTMYTSLCRLGVIKSVEIYRDPATGRVDWTLPESAYVYNKFSTIGRSKRKLIFYEDYDKKITLPEFLQ